MKKQKKSKSTTYIIIAAVAIIAVAAAVFALIRISDAKKYDNYYQDGKQYYDSGDYESAANYLERAVKIKHSDEAVLLLADCYVNLDEKDKAISLLEQYSDSSAVRDRLEELRSSSGTAGGKIEIGGETFDADTVSFGMSGRELTSADIEGISGFTALESASLSKNDITSLEMFSNLSTLEVLDLSKNKISDITPLAGLSRLRTLYLDDNDINDFKPLYGLKNLTTLSIKGIDITENQLKELQDALPGCRIHSEKADVDVVDITLGGVKFKSDVTELDLSGKGISDISALSQCENLQRLNLRNNRISDLTPLMDLPDLQWLSLRGNRVDDLRPLMGLTRLTYLDLQTNNFTSIASIGALSDLTNLYLGGNKLGSFAAITDFTDLKELGLENTGLGDDDVVYLKGLSRLTKLYVENNPDLTQSGISELQTALKNCKISHSELTSAVNLGGTKFPADSVSVDASGLGLTDISGAAGFTSCTTLLLANNKITDIKPLFGLKTLKTLDISNNKISDLSPLVGLTNLQSLNVSGNSFTDVTTLQSMTWLKELYISSSGLTEDQINSLYYSLPGCQISVDGYSQ
jgi:internalin A